MKTVTIADSRKFSLTSVQRSKLLVTGDIEVGLLCFEAGQTDEETVHHASCIYQVLEGEALVLAGEDRERLGKGRLLAVEAGVPHLIENAGGGLLVVMVTRGI